jgi:uncharacterized protein with HEPN domain
MLTASHRAIGYCQGMTLEDFVDDPKSIDACVMNLIVLAEASKGIPEELKLKFSEIPWRAIAGFRNRAAHSNLTADLSLDVSIVWRICSDELPKMVPHLEALLRHDS